VPQIFLIVALKWLVVEVQDHRVQVAIKPFPKNFDSTNRRANTFHRSISMWFAKSLYANRKASVSLAERDGDEVVYVSARLKDVVSSAAQLHRWNQPAGVNVNIANIPMPTEEERAEMRALDAKLDAIAAKLKA
jgi:hypothetical protein